MAIERTFSILKPDATERNLTGAINAIIEKAGSIAVSSTPDELQQVITQTLDDVAVSIREFGLQQEQ